MKKQIQTALTALSIAALVLILTACGKAGGRRASDWNGTWYREGDIQAARCEVTIKNAKKSGFDFSLMVYNGNLAGQLKNCHADFEGTSAFYYAEDPRSYIEFFFDEHDDSKLNIIFTSTGEYVEWTAFENFRDNAYVTGIYAKTENYMFNSLSEMGILPDKSDQTLQRMMGDNVYFRLMQCFQTYSVERSSPTGSNLPYEYNGSIHMHDGIGANIYYASMTDQQYAAIVVDYDDGTVSAAVSLENGSVSYYSDNEIYLKEQPYPIIMWVEKYTNEQSSHLIVSQ